MDTLTLLQDIAKNTKREFYSTESLNVSLAANGGNTSIADINTSGAGLLTIQCNNQGTSTLIEVAVFCSIGSLGYTSASIGVMNLNTTKRNDVMFVSADFDKAKVVVTNKDTTNASTVDIAVKVLGS